MFQVRCMPKPAEHLNGEAGAARDARHAGKVGADGTDRNNQIGARLVLVVQSTTAALRWPYAQAVSHALTGRH
jgi:hypothetical protein